MTRRAPRPDRETEGELVTVHGRQATPSSYGGDAGTDLADVVVVGAGPAGSMTALLLARRGLQVILVERRAFPRPKPCGDCLSAAATELLRRTGLLEGIAAKDPAWLEGWSVTSPGGRTCTGRFGAARGLAVERSVLDAVLRDAALDAGARAVTSRVVGLIRAPGSRRVAGVRVRDAAGERALRGRLVVGADGLRSIVARRLGTIRRTPRLRKVSLTTHVVTRPDLPPLGRMHVLEGGCIALAPVARDRANLTLVTDARHAARLAGVGAERFLREWLDRAPDLLDAVRPPDPRSGAPPVFEEILASGPFDWPSRGPVRDGAALVGDAAGYYDPFTGQGIFQALAGAEALASRVAPALTGGAPAAVDAALASYAGAQRRLTRPARRVQKGIEAVLSRPRLADLALARLARAPAVMDRLVEVTGDLRPPRSLLSPALLSRFLVPPSPETP